MNYAYYNFGFLEKGKTIVVELSNSANVKLMNHDNYNHYKKGQQYKYFGGKAKKTPLYLTIPKTDYWYLIIDLGGYSGTVKHNAFVL